MNDYFLVPSFVVLAGGPCVLIVGIGCAYYIGYARACKRMLDVCKTVPEFDAIRRHVVEKM